MTNANEWVESPEHPGYRVKTIKRDGYTLQILRPILNEKEEAKRERHLKAVAESVLTDYFNRKEQTT